MLWGSIYHIKDTLIPAPTQAHLTDNIKLFNIVVSKVLEDGNSARKFLPHIPKHLFIQIFQAGILKHFSKNGRFLPESLTELVLHWPYSSFTLSELMPNIPPHSDEFMIVDHENMADPLEVYRDRLDWFHSCVVDSLIRSFLSSACDDSPIRKLDVSGYCKIIYDYFALCPEPLLETIRNINRNTLPQGEIKLELIADACHGCAWDQDNINTISELSNSSHCESACAAVHFRKVVVDNIDGRRHMKEPIVKLLSENNTEFLEIESTSFDLNVLRNVSNYFHNTMKHLRGLSLYKSRDQEISLAFLSGMQNLQQLEISQFNLNNKLSPLCKVKAGLKYLKFCNCTLRSNDLDELANSVHVASLQQLDIIHNDLSGYREAVSLVSLCNTLSVIEALNLRGCSMGKWNSELIKKFVATIQTLPELTILDLQHNSFSTNTLKCEFIGLAKNMTLRFLSLSIPVPDDINEEELVEGNSGPRPVEVIQIRHEEVDIAIGAEDLIADVARIDTGNLNNDLETHEDHVEECEAVEKKKKEEIVNEIIKPEESLFHQQIQDLHNTLYLAMNRNREIPIYVTLTNRG